ncbi:class I SAM-dependent methyltransferase [Tsuneonella sp. YG55]|uniref:Class I SAM-dependent methyltransferase n=1 Tax=Tsuneonella litorea TaxID=2976475 RepID=A0A9X2VZ03_9SPHN|nr:class I SAM-dependent methyltransferase [Tsuneonella litorea]MCT2557737.1 class I SAM-dependent methyltransferase [Tsuneonella litorea]
MAGQDATFAGAIPQIYDECLVPVLFAPYAEDLARAAAARAPADVLEVAAGTGAVTTALAAALPGARIVATDLNPGMIERARSVHDLANVEWAVADAQSLPFADGSFDLVAIQFGAMFFPDRVCAYREIRRVLRDGGALLANVWGPLEDNPGSAVIHDTLCAMLPEPRPGFIARTPFGYHDPVAIRAEIAAAGFAECAVTTVAMESPPGSAARLLKGMTEGSPLHAELVAHDPGNREAAIAAAAKRLEALEARGPLGMTALRIVATR